MEISQPEEYVRLETEDLFFEELNPVVNAELKSWHQLMVQSELFKMRTAATLWK